MPPPYTEMARLNTEHEHQKLASQNMTDMLFILYFLETCAIYFLTGVKTWTKINDEPLFYVDIEAYTPPPIVTTIWLTKIFQKQTSNIKPFRVYFK